MLVSHPDNNHQKFLITKLYCVAGKFPNLANHQHITKLKPPKLVAIVDKLLADLFTYQTFLPKSSLIHFANNCCHQIYTLIIIYIRSKTLRVWDKYSWCMMYDSIHSKEDGIESFVSFHYSISSVPFQCCIPPFQSTDSRQLSIYNSLTGMVMKLASRWQIPTMYIH